MILKLVANFSWSYVANLMARLSGLAVTIIVARVLSVQSFGHYAFIQTTLLVCQAISTFGIVAAITKFTAELKETQPTQASSMIGHSIFRSAQISLACTALVILGSLVLPALVLPSSDVSMPLAIAALAIPALTITAVLQGVMAGLGAFSAVARTNFLVGTVTVALVAIAAFLQSLMSIACALVVASIFSLAINLWILRTTCLASGIEFKLLRPQPSQSIREAFWSFAASSAVISFAIWPTQWFCSFMLAKESPQQLAIFYVALQLSNTIIGVIDSVGSVLMPMFIEARRDGQENRLLHRATAFNLIAVFVLILVIAPFQRDILSAFGAQYAADPTTLFTLLLTGLVIAIQTPASRMMHAHDQVAPLAKLSVIWSILHIGGYLVYEQQGALGFAVSRLFAYAAHTLLIAYLFKRYSSR